MFRTEVVAVLDEGDLELEPDPEIFADHVHVLVLPPPAVSLVCSLGWGKDVLDGELDDLLLHLVPPDHLEPVRPDPRSPTRLTEVHANHGWCDDVFAIVSFCREIHAFLADDLVRGDFVDRVMDGLTKDRLEGVGQGMPGPKGRRGVGFGIG